MARPRITIKSNLVGSSDLSRIKSAQAIRELNHKEFIGSKAFTIISATEAPVWEPKDTDTVKVSICGKLISCLYGIVKKANYTWSL